VKVQDWAVILTPRKMENMVLDVARFVAGCNQPDSRGARRESDGAAQKIQQQLHKHTVRKQRVWVDSISEIRHCPCSVDAKLKRERAPNDRRAGSQHCIGIHPCLH